MWGSCAAGPSKTGVTLTCDCHSPAQQRATYRALRTLPTGPTPWRPTSWCFDPAVILRCRARWIAYFGQVYGAQSDLGPHRWSNTSRCTRSTSGASSATPSTTRSAQVPGARTRRPDLRVQAHDALAEQLDRLQPVPQNQHGNIDAPNPLGITGGATAHEPVCQNCHVARHGGR